MRTRLLQLSIGFEDVRMNAVAREDRDVHTPDHLPCAVGMSRRHTNITEVCVQIDSRIPARLRRPLRQFRRAQFCQRRLIISSLFICVLQVHFEREWSEGLIGSFLCKYELLSERKSDNPSNAQT